MNENGEQVADAARRKEYETGMAGREFREELRDQSIRDHVEYVLAGRNASAAGGENGGAVDEGADIDRDWRDRAVNVDLSIWCDSDREQHEILMEVLTDRAKTDARPPAEQRDDWVQRIPDVNRVWEGTTDREGTQPRQFPSLVLKSVRFDELRRERREAIQGRMDATLEKNYGGDRKVTADFAKINIVTLEDTTGRPYDKTQRGLPRIALYSSEGMSRYLNPTPASGLTQKQMKERKAIGKGFVNPGVNVHLKPAIFGIRAAGEAAQPGGFRVVNRVESAMAFADVAEEKAVVGGIAERNIYAYQFSDVRKEIEANAGSEVEAKELGARRVGELALDENVPEGVREAARWASTGVAMKENAGLVDMIAVGDPRRNSLRGVDPNDDREVMRSRNLMLRRDGVVNGLEKLVKGEGRSTCGVNPDTGEPQMNREKRPRVGDLTADGCTLNGTDIHASMGVVRAAPKRGQEASQRMW